MRRLVYLIPVSLVAALVGWRVLRPAAVTVAAATVGTAIEAVYATGTVEADPRVEVKTKVPGTIVEIAVKEGDRVRAGQLLARIDNKTLRFDLQRTRADLRAANQKSGSASPQLAASKAQRESIASDVKLAEGELGRAESLVARGAMARDELDRRRERMHKLRAEWAAANARVASLEIDLRAERERVGAAEGSLKAQNADTEVVAPMDGTVIRRRVELGETVISNQPLFVVGDTDHLVLEVKIDEADVGRVRLGQETLVDLYAFSDRVVQGKLAELVPDADRDTKTFMGKVELVNPPKGLRSGMSAEVNVVAERHEGVVLVPAGAVLAGRVMVVSDGRVSGRTVQTGLKDPRNVEIKHGLKVGERVVVVGSSQLKEGARVRVLEGGAPPAVRVSRNTTSVQ